MHAPARDLCHEGHFAFVVDRGVEFALNRPIYAINYGLAAKGTGRFDYIYHAS